MIPSFHEGDRQVLKSRRSRTNLRMERRGLLCRYCQAPVFSETEVRASVSTKKPTGSYDRHFQQKFKLKTPGSKKFAFGSLEKLRPNAATDRKCWWISRDFGVHRKGRQ